MNIHHRPLVNIELAEKLYTEKDGVPVKYVCTSALGSEEFAYDIFYRDTPHPGFGNRYFGLRWINEQLFINNADAVENIEFEMLEIDGVLHYSQHRHDFNTVGDVSIDGGRAYLRTVGNLSYPVKTLVIRDGEFTEKVDDQE